MSRGVCLVAHGTVGHGARLSFELSCDQIRPVVCAVSSRCVFWSNGQNWVCAPGFPATSEYLRNPESQTNTSTAPSHWTTAITTRPSPPTHQQVEDPILANRPSKGARVVRLLPDYSHPNMDSVNSLSLQLTRRPPPVLSASSCLLPTAANAGEEMALNS